MYGRLTPEVLDRLYDIESKLDRLIIINRLFLRMEAHMAADLTALTAAVENDTSVVNSAITLLQNLSSQLAEAANDPVAVNALAEQIGANSAALAAAVVANTPAQ